MDGLRRLALSLTVAVCAVGLVTVLCHSVPWAQRMADIVMLYLLCVVAIAGRFGYVASLVTAALSVAALDFFFTEPYLSFAVADKRHLITFAIMLFVAFFISYLTERVRRSAEQARERELYISRVFSLSREIATARTAGEIALAACSQIEGVFATDVDVLLPEESGDLRRFTRATGADGTLEPGTSALAHAIGRILRSDVPVEDRQVFDGSGTLMALQTTRSTLGVLSIRQRTPKPSESAPNRELLDAFACQTVLGLERVRLAEEAQRAQFEVHNERLRNALLSSVSHDLRTPLAVVKGAVSALLDGGAGLTAARRQEYLETISDETNRLNRLVRNLLNMTSLEAGALRARKEWLPLEEVVGVALNRLDEQLEGRPVRVEIAPDAALVPLDAILFEQVLVNLVENATRYTPPGTPIFIRACSVEQSFEVEVADRGPGVPPGEEEHIFQKFRRASATALGMGLGLTICRGIVEVHGGRIWCQNLPEGGASFRLRLPREGEPPAMQPLPESIADS